jgi:hypothetical protein
MTAYRVVSIYSELSKCICIGNLTGVRKLFEQKKASPFDKIEGQHITMSLLDVSNSIPKINYTLSQRVNVKLLTLVR